MTLSRYGKQANSQFIEIRVVPDGLPAFIKIPKNASSAANNMLDQTFKTRMRTTILGRDEWDLGRPMVALWRDPFERAESCYRYQKGNNNIGYPGVTVPEVDLGFADWMEQLLGIEDMMRDKHVQSQTERCRDWDGNFMPTQIVRWDMVELGRIYGTSMRISNRSKAAETIWSTELREEFSRQFAPDIRIWETGGR